MQARKNKKDDWSWAEDPKEQRPAPSPGAVWLSDLYPLGASLPAIDEEETVQQPLAAEEADASDLDVDDPEFNLPAALPASVPEEAIDPDDYDDGDDAIDGGVAIHAEDYDDGADGDDLDDDWDDGRRKLSPGAVRLSDLYPSGDPYADADEAVPLSALAEEGDVSNLDVPDFSFTNYKGQPAAPGPARVEDDEIGINDYDTDDDYAEAPPAQDQAATVAQLQDQIRQLREQLAQKDALIAKLMAGRA